MDKRKAREEGLTLAILVIGFLWMAIYALGSYLSRLLGDELAFGIALVSGLFSTGVLFPIQNAYVSLKTKRYCRKNGHLLKHHMAADGRAFVLCDRCYSMMINEPLLRDMSSKH